MFVSTIVRVDKAVLTFQWGGRKGQDVSSIWKEVKVVETKASVHF